MPELPEVEVVRAGLAPAVTGARIVAAEVRDARALKRHLPLGASGNPADVGQAQEHQRCEASDCACGAATAAANGAKRGVGHGVTLSADAGAARAADFERRVTGLRLSAPRRRGKFMWIPVDPASSPPVKPAAPLDPESAAPLSEPVEGSEPTRLALLAHLGMSGQLLLRSHEAPDDRHVRIRLWIEHPEHGELRLDFADQRLFGSLALDALVADHSVPTDSIPAQAAHIALDPLDPAFDDLAFLSRLVSRSIGIKKLLLDQTVVSGVGNIYADEALWRARLHPERSGTSLSRRKAAELLAALRAVFAQALAEGGTSFDEQYVNVNGQAGYFSRSLHVYGRQGKPCDRCSTLIVRESFMNRGSHFCPRCQRVR